MMKRRTDGCFVLVREFVVHISVHQRGLANTRVPQNDDLQQNLLTGSHDASLFVLKERIKYEEGERGMEGRGESGCC